MTNTSNSTGGAVCALGTWAVALLGGVVTAALLMILGGWTFLQAAFAGIVVLLAVGAFLSWTLCRPLPRPGETSVERAPVASPSKAVPETAPAPTGVSPTAQRAMAMPVADAPAATPAPKAARPAERPATEGAAPPASEEAKKPASLGTPRDEGPDDLKRIKGIGPKLEAMLHRMGYFHFDQIAGWTDREVAWVDENLEGFRGRVTRDNWVSQARVLAGGGETDFSGRVDKGEVY